MGSIGVSRLHVGVKTPVTGRSATWEATLTMQRTAITVGRARDEVTRLWATPGYRTEYIDQHGATVAFKDAPADRGTEIHVDLGGRGADGLGGLLRKVGGAPELAKVKDELRRFKQRVETGVVPRSDGTPEGESAERKLKQRPAQPLKDSELPKAGVA
jgi:uncharacterized membrane protein